MNRPSCNQLRILRADRRVRSRLPLRFLIAVLALVAFASQAPAETPSAQGSAPVDFNRDIRPILSNKCFFCHGPEEEHRGADLRLDTLEGLFGEETGSPAVEAGDAEASLLIERITSDDEDERMPPVDSGKNLSAEEIELLRQWIDQGAEWQQHWAYVPPVQHKRPEVKRQHWPRNWIDHFVLARLEKEGLSPAVDADRVTLVRRLSFDILGLPPTPEQVEQFVNSRDPQAYERLVDELLASPHYGERMAMYWLDLVRYADTVGYHGDQTHNISPYRDYVIDSFNDNKPLDQFTAEQLAGDLLPDSSIDDKIASGYNRMLQTSHEGGVQQKEYLAIYAADRVRNFSAVWLGGTLGCAQCHDHKFDPYTMKDFYSLVSFFADIDETSHFTNSTNSLPTRRYPEMDVLTRRQREEIAGLEKQIAGMELQLAEDEIAADARATLQQDVEAMKKHQDAIAANKRATMITVSIKPRTIRILPRGNWLSDAGEVVLPAVPEFLGNVTETNSTDSEAADGVSANGDRRLTRLDLARWLFDKQNGVAGLSARVYVNRLWYLFHGVGIARMLDDLGGQGEPPVHPELLDNLAVEFADSGWDTKAMVKRMVMSRTYQQSSVVDAALLKRDPYNQLFARQSRYRLQAEMVRDTALSIAGLLVKDVGGASIKPYQPAGYYRHLNFPQRRYYHHGDRRQWRRGVYVHWQRQFLHPALKAMDAPSREECTAQRSRSNTPIGAFPVANDPTYVEAARVFTTRVLREGGNTFDSRLSLAFRLALSREPDPLESRVLRELLGKSRKRFEKDPEDARRFVEIGQAKLPEDMDAVEVASWSSIARVIFNLSETMTRN